MLPSSKTKGASYHLADVESTGVWLPPDGPEETVHMLDGADLLLVVLLLRVFGDERHVQTSVRFTHRLHLSVLPQIDSIVLQLFGAVCADEAVEVPQNLQREYQSSTNALAARPPCQYLLCAVIMSADSYPCLSNDQGCLGP